MQILKKQRQASPAWEGVNRSMEAIIAAYVLSLVVASGALMYSLLRAEKPK